MAFKFQVGPAILSGSTKFEEGVEVTSLKFSGSVDTGVDIGADSILFRDSDGSVKSDSLVDYAALIAGDGLGASGGALSVGVDDSSIETSGDALRVKALGVTNAMLAGSIADSKLNQITTGDKVAGSAVQLAGTSALEDSTGLQLKSATAGDGLAMNSQVLSVNVDDSSIETDSDSLRVKALGITNAMLAGSIADSKLNQITTGDKVAGSSVQLAGTSALEDSTGLRLKAATAGDGLAISSQVLSVDLNELSAAAVSVANDSIAIIDADDSNGSKKESISDFMSAVAGTALQESSGQLRVKVTGSVARSLGAVGVSGSIAGSGLSFQGNEASVTALDLSIGEFSTVQVASGDKFLMLDSDGSTHQLETVDSLSQFQAGVGLGHSGGVLSVDLNELAGGDVAVSADSIAFIDADGNGSKKESISDFVTAIASTAAGMQAASGQLGVNAGKGLAVSSQQLVLDISGLDAGTINVATDAFAFDDSGTSKKLTIADLMTAVAGDGITAENGILEVEVAELGAVTAIASGDTFAISQESETGDPTKKITFDNMATKLAGQGLTANAGVLNFRQDVGLKADGGSLAPGVNYFADASANASVTLPAAPAVGDTVTVKAGNLTSGAKIIINRQGSHVIDDDLTSVEIESPFGAITCVYVVANEWRLI
jgi:hypothetical protein